MNTISIFQEYVQHYDDLSYYFDGRVHYCELIDDDGGVLILQELVEDSSQEILYDYRVVIVDRFNYENTIEETFTIKYSTFEIHTTVGTRIIEVFKWDGLVIIRHGGHFLSK